MTTRVGNLTLTNTTISGNTSATFGDGGGQLRQDDADRLTSSGNTAGYGGGLLDDIGHGRR